MVDLVCYNLKATNIYIFGFNQNQNLIKNTVHNFQLLTQYKSYKRFWHDFFNYQL